MELAGGHDRGFWKGELEGESDQILLYTCMKFERINNIDILKLGAKHASLTPALRDTDRWIPVAHWPASLVESMS